jgi:hypothetical protein
MRKLTVLLALISISIASAQNWDKEKVKGNGVQTTVTRTTENYDKIAVQGSFNVELIAAKEGTIAINGDENLMEYLITEVVDQELKIYFKKNINYSYKNKITITVPFEEINEVSLTGSGEIITKNTINANNFEVKMTGSGDCKLQINAQKTIAKFTGSGNLELLGTTDELEAKTAGSGAINCLNLASQNVNATVAGSGDLQVNCSNNLIAKVAGSGTIKYTGNPKTTDTKVSGSGDISGY